MNYMLILRPIGPQSRPDAVVTEADGKSYPEINAGILNTAAKVSMAQQIPGANASPTQVTALALYLTKIKAGTDTSAVETAITNA